MNITRKPHPVKYAPALFAAAFSLFSALLSAQTQPTAPAPDEKETVVLSPFVVSTTQDSGYQATDTLAGTRLRTQLKDIAASIGVVTKDFLEDTGVTNLAQLLTYTTGTETQGVGGNFAGYTPNAAGSDAFASRREFNAPQRVRGLAAADLTRNYFATSIPFDAYNTDSVTINRGANSILFGLGSPAGIIETSTLNVRFRNSGKAEVRYDEWGSHRESLDFERVLLDKKLSIRVATLNDRQEFEQKPSYRNQQRNYGVVVYKPFQNTTIKASGESGKLAQNLPMVALPDDLLSPWWKYGKQLKTTSVVNGPNFNIGNFAGDPTGNPTLNYWRFNNQDGAAGSWFYNPGVIYASPTSGSPSDSFTAYGDSAVTATNLVAQQFRFLAPRSVGGMYQATLLDPLWNTGFLATPSLTDRSIFDYRKYQLKGPNSGTDYNFKAVDLSGEQLFLNGNAGVEVAYNYQSGIDTRFDAMDTARGWIMIDENQFTTDGRPNPNVGRPFTSSRGMSSRTWNDSNHTRVTAFVKYNFAEKSDRLWAKILGEQTVNSFYQADASNVFNLSGTYAVFDPSYIPGDSSTGKGNRTVTSVVYLGPSLLGASSPVGANIQPITAQLVLPDSLSTWTLNKQNNYVWTKTPVTIHTFPDFDYNTDSVGGTRNQVKSYGAVWQGNFWDNLFVTTLGSRHDEVDTFSSGSTGTNPATGAAYTTRGPLVPRLSVANNLTSQGYALHVPPKIMSHLPGRLGLSLYFNKSGNFITTGFRQTPIGEGVAPQSGTTKEYGIGLTALDGKFSLRMANYQTEQINTSNGTLSGSVANIAELEKRVQGDHTPAELAAGGYVGLGIGTPSALYQRYITAWNMKITGQDALGRNVITYSAPTGNTVTASAVSRGLEFEGTYNPLPNWRISFNAAKQQATNGAIDPLYGQLVADRLPYWSLPGIANLTATSGWTTMTYGQQNVINQFNIENLKVGGPVFELRKWRFNATTNYQFARKSKLNGWAIGGSVRWQDKAAIGYPVLTDPVLGYIKDVKHPFMDGNMVTYDGVISYHRLIYKNKLDWKIQLNVYNLANNNQLLPVAANPVALNNTKDFVIAQYRIGAGRSWQLTSSFAF